MGNSQNNEMNVNQSEKFETQNNIALNKHVQLSSIFEADNPKAFTKGTAATDGNYDPNKNRMGGFGTMPTINPWAVIDLEKNYKIHQVNLFHREGFFERTKHIRIEASMDGQHFEFIKDLNNLEFEKKTSDKNECGYVFVVEIPLEIFAARYLKFTLVTDKRRYFHLNQIEVFGAEIVDRNKESYIHSIIGDYNPEFEYSSDRVLTTLSTAKNNLVSIPHRLIRRFANEKDLSSYPLNWLSSKRGWPAHALSQRNEPEDDRVSVVITTYNRLDKLKTAIASFLNTQHNNFEFIIVDDGSTDGTVDFLQSLTSNESVIFRSIFNQQTGYRENKLEGVLASTGEYLIVFDDDDFVVNDSYIDCAIREMKSTGVGGVFHKAIIYNFKTNKVILPQKEMTGIFTTSELVGNQLSFYGNTQTHIYDGKKFRDNLPKELSRLDDEQITYIGMLGGEVKISSDYSIVYRREAGQLSRNMTWETHYKYNAMDFSIILREMVNRGLIEKAQYFKFLADAILGVWGAELNRGEALDIINDLIMIAPKTFKNKIYILGVPEYGNIGDQAISFAMKVFIERYSNLEVIETRFSDSLYKANEIRKLWMPGNIVVYPGGGNMGSLWPWEEAGREKILSNFEDKPIIIFPQSIFFEEEKASELESAEHFYNSLSDTQLFTRENQSYQFALEHFSKVTNHLVPDIVFSLPYNSKNEERQGLLTLLRGDKEKSVSISEQKKMLSDLKRRFKLVTESDTVVDHQITHPSQREYEVNKLLDTIASHEVVVTDRMHGMIFAYVTKTPAVVFNNSYHKSKGTYDLWLKDCPWIKMVDSVEQVDDAITEVISHKDEPFEVDQSYFQPLIDVLNQTK